MPRFYFEINDGTTVTPDVDGCEMQDLHAAELQAARTLGEIARDVLHASSSPYKLSIGIGNGAGQQLMEVSLAYAVSTRHET